MHNDNRIEYQQQRPVSYKIQFERGNTKGRWSKRENKTSLCKNWLRVKVCCVHKFLCAIRLLCKGICVKCKKCKKVLCVKPSVRKTSVRKTFWEKPFSVKIVVHWLHQKNLSVKASVRKSFCCVKTVQGKVSACKKNGVFFLVQSVCTIFSMYVFSVPKKSVCNNCSVQASLWQRFCV